MSGLERRVGTADEAIDQRDEVKDNPGHSFGTIAVTMCCPVSESTTMNGRPGSCGARTWID
jgi:hypothetical protein